MLFSDCSKHRADHRRRSGAGWDDALWEEDAQPFDPDAPWDDAAAEALMSLCESEEGRLWGPSAGDRARPSLARAADGEPEPEEDGLDRAWLEAHLSGLADRLQQAVAQADPQAALAALTGRLETIEQRFGATLGRIAQRTDRDGLRAIETRVLELAAQLEQARERLDRIGAVDEQVRALARKVEESGALRTGGLEKLLRDCIAEWREGEQRTASALQHIEEAITRLGETVEAMEASKPATDLAVPPLTGPEPGRAADPNGAFTRPPALYHSALDAADYAPKPLVAEEPAASGPPLLTADTGAQGSTIDRLPDPGREDCRPTGAGLTPGALRIMALRAKLRQSNGNGRGGAPARVPPGAAEEQRRGEIRRASLSILLIAGAALVASSTYYLYQIYVVATAVGQ
jgi:hypothetical protein